VPIKIGAEERGGELRRNREGKKKDSNIGGSRLYLRSVLQTVANM